jgi:hypothetical protein
MSPICGNWELERVRLTRPFFRHGFEPLPASCGTDKVPIRTLCPGAGRCYPFRSGHGFGALSDDSSPETHKLPTGYKLLTQISCGDSIHVYVSLV